MTAPVDLDAGRAAVSPRRGPRWLPGAAAVPALRLFERNVVAWRGRWVVFASVLLEPVLFLLSIGVGVGALVGDVSVGNGASVPYRVFVGGGLLASSAMFGPVYDTTYNFFIKLKYMKLYDAVLATPLRPFDVVAGELLWSVVRGAIYAAVFLATMGLLGLVASWWALLAVPAAALIGFAAGGVGLAGSTYMRSFVDFDWVSVGVIPMFLLSTTFYPLSRYPEGWQAVIQATPLYQGVLLERSLVLGDVSASLFVPALYLAVLGTMGLRIAAGRMERLLQP